MLPQYRPPGTGDAAAGVTGTVVARAPTSPRPEALGAAPRDKDDPGVRVEIVLAALTVVLIGVRQNLHTQVTSGYVLAVLFAPLWIRWLRHYRGARPVLLAGLAAAVWGLLMSELGDSSHVVSSVNRDNSLALMLGTVVSIGAVLWARSVMRDTTVALLFGAGMALGGVAGFTSAGGNAWKFVYAVPVGLILLSLTAATGRRRLQVLALAGLMLVSVVHDSRSYLATFLLTGLLLLWQWRPSELSARASWVLNVAGLGVLGWGVYYLGTTLLLNGYLGRDAQLRSIQQIEQSGSLLLGGRPELAATWALLKHKPWGFGTGVLANPGDVLAAKRGMFAVGYAPNNGYVDRFMFGGNIELHSMFGDLWATFGIVGLAIAAGVAFLTVRGMARALAARTASPVLLFVCIWTLWNVAFSPLLAATPTLILTLAFVLPANVGVSAPAAPRSRESARRTGSTTGRVR